MPCTCSGFVPKDLMHLFNMVPCRRHWRTCRIFRAVMAHGQWHLQRQQHWQESWLRQHNQPICLSVVSGHFQRAGTRSARFGRRSRSDMPTALLARPSLRSSRRSRRSKEARPTVPEPLFARFERLAAAARAQRASQHNWDCGRLQPPSVCRCSR